MPDTPLTRHGAWLFLAAMCGVVVIASLLVAGGLYLQQRQVNDELKAIQDNACHQRQQIQRGQNRLRLVVLAAVQQAADARAADSRSAQTPERAAAEAKVAAEFQALVDRVQPIQVATCRHG